MGHYPVSISGLTHACAIQTRTMSNRLWKGETMYSPFHGYSSFSLFPNVSHNHLDFWVNYGHRPGLLCTHQRAASAATAANKDKEPTPFGGIGPSVSSLFSGQWAWLLSLENGDSFLSIITHFDMEIWGSAFRDSIPFNFLQNPLSRNKWIHFTCFYLRWAAMEWCMLLRLRRNMRFFFFCSYSSETTLLCGLLLHPSIGHLHPWPTTASSKHTAPRKKKLHWK